MKHRKILVVSTYPIKNPKHGGQKRTAAIFNAYKQKFAQAKHSAVFFKGFYSDFDEDDIPLGKNGQDQVMRSPYTGDIIAGKAIIDDPKVKNRFSKILTSFNPDIIHIEQPYPYLGIKPLLKELRLNPKIIFGSQNIEAPMKREILESAGLSSDHIANAEGIIEKLERSFSLESDLVVACTQGDLKAHEKLGARKIVLAQNGIDKSTTNAQSLNYWRNIFDKNNIKKTVLFIGSAHPPNWTGFKDMVSLGLGFLPLDSRIVVVGSISDFFEREVDQNSLNMENATFWLRAISAGRVNEQFLGALIQLSNVILLPITEGGGSNLKTAEAILADKKVVATSYALRSFDWFKDFPNLWIADTASMFREHIIEALNTPHKPRTLEQNRLVKRVEWNNCLSEMLKQVENL